MIHEPECRQMQIRDWQICDCSVIRKAYQRGREDAAKAVDALGKLRIYEVYTADDGYLAGAYVDAQEQIAAAARGNQECYCESCNDPDCGCLGCAAARGVGLTGIASSSDLDADEIRIKDGEQA